jgi:hypothetical protein
MMAFEHLNFYVITDYWPYVCFVFNRHFTKLR